MLTQDLNQISKTDKYMMLAILLEEFIKYEMVPDSILIEEFIIVLDEIKSHL